MRIVLSMTNFVGSVKFYITAYREPAPKKLQSYIGFSMIFIKVSYLINELGSVLQWLLVRDPIELGFW